jgi:hypothetical protein
MSLVFLAVLKTAQPTSLTYEVGSLDQQISKLLVIPEPRTTYPQCRAATVSASPSF